MQGGYVLGLISVISPPDRLARPLPGGLITAVRRLQAGGYVILAVQ